MQAALFSRITSVVRFSVVSLAVVAGLQLHASDNFTKPTQEELSMTSLPGYPGAAAVVLFREEQTKDELHVVQFYDRIKILTEEGKKYANVQLTFATARGGYFDMSDETMMGDIVGRTIHPDGSIVPFTGKPYLKVIENSSDLKVQQKVFTLPDVTVGSIIEYRYSRRFSDSFYEAPDWYIQGDLFVKSAHYLWAPTRRPMTDSQGKLINAISWFPVLPLGAEIKTTEIPRSSVYTEGTTLYELSVKDIPPTVKEDHMPPLSNFSYRVLFNYTAYRSQDEYWKTQGKQWSKLTDSFIGSTSNLAKHANEITAGATSEDDKLKKIYAAVMQFENTQFTRERGQREEKINNASDVISHKRGSPVQITDTFVGLARAAGLHAYAMIVSDRSETIFAPQWLYWRQFSDELAVVTIDGKERFFDPGERYCPYGQLGWEHTLVRGIRQIPGGTDFANTSIENYSANRTARVANLTMDEHGEVSGKLDLTFFGAPALRWRQRALSGDAESLNRSLEAELEKMVPGSLEIKIAKIQNTDDYEKPLIVNYTAKGTMSTVTGKRVVLPADLFSSGESATFTHDKRELPVYFHYPEAVVDAVRIIFPKNLSIEAVPDAVKLKWKNEGLYSLTVESAPTNVTARRNFILNEVIVPTKDYTEFRAFYSQLEAKDKDSVVLKPIPMQAQAEPPSADN